jgi:hypothetical protein
MAHSAPSKSLLVLQKHQSSSNCKKDLADQLQLYVETKATLVTMLIQYIQPVNIDIVIFSFKILFCNIGILSISPSGTAGALAAAHADIA